MTTSDADTTARLPTNAFLVAKAVEGKSKACRYCGRVFSGDHFVRNSNRHVGAFRAHRRCYVNRTSDEVLQCFFCPKLFKRQHRYAEREKLVNSKYLADNNGHCKVYKKRLKTTVPVLGWLQSLNLPPCRTSAITCAAARRTRSAPRPPASS